MSKKDYINGIEGAQRRFSCEIRAIEPQDPAGPEAREDGSAGQLIEGYAFKVDERTSLPWFDEIIRAGAADDVLGDDVRCLINHDPNLVLARSIDGEGTLDLFVDSVGLGYRFEAPDTSYGRDLAENVRLGNISQSSFAFTILEERWIWAENEGERDLREILKIGRLYDVSPVTYPAYSATTVTARDAWQAAKDERDRQKQKDEKETRRGLDRARAILLVNQNKSK